MKTPRKHVLLFIFVWLLVLTYFQILRFASFQDSKSPKVENKNSLDAQLLQQLNTEDREDKKAEDVLCATKTAMFCNESVLNENPWLFPFTAIASFPGSGNTWLRYLIEQITGVTTGSVYCDGTLKRQYFKGECLRDRRVFGVKTHEWGSNTRDNYIKAVIVIRNPYEAIISYYNFYKAGHTGHAKEIYFQTEDWFDFIKTRSLYWEEFHYDWLLRFTGSLHILFYEKLKTNMREEYIRLAKFLERPLTDKAIKCFLQDHEGKFHRKSDKNENELNRYSEKYQIVMDRYIKNITQYVKSRFPLFDVNITK